MAVLTWTTAEQAAAGALSLEDVHRLIAYLVGEIGGWQAPVDDVATREWSARVHGMLAGSKSTELTLEAFISNHLVRFLREARRWSTDGACTIDYSYHTTSTTRERVLTS